MNYPLIDPKKSIKVIKPIQSKKFDYAGLHTFPERVNTEGFSFKSLEKAWKNARLPSSDSTLLTVSEIKDLLKEINLFLKIRRYFIINNKLDLS